MTKPPPLDLFGNLPPERYPDAPGHRGIDTSVEAADAIKTRVTGLRARALAAIGWAGAYGITTSELAARTGIDYAAIQPRTSELRKMGLIVDSRRRRMNHKGKREIVWTTKEHAGV